MGTAQLDRTFQALADPVRLAIVERLEVGDVSVSGLSAPLPISLQAVSKHIGVLERAGLVVRLPRGRERVVHLEPTALTRAASWMEARRHNLETRYQRLDGLLADLQEERMTKTTHERSSAQSLVHRRRFAAAPELVQRAHTDPELFRRWVGPRDSTMRLDSFNAVTGGRFDYTVELGGSWRFWGSYHEVREGRIVHTWEFEQEPGRPSLEILEFHAHPEGCELVVTSVFASVQDCEDMIQSGLDGGMDENFAQLDEVLTAMA